MSPASKVFVLPVLGVVCVLLIAVLFVSFLERDSSTEVGKRLLLRLEAEREEAMTARQEISYLRTKIEALKAAADESAVDIPSSDVVENIEAALLKADNALRQNDALLEHLEHEDYVAVTGSQVAAQNLSTAEVVIGGLSVAFAIVLFGATILTALNLHSYKEEADKKAAAVEAQFEKLSRRGEAMLSAGRKVAQTTLGDLTNSKTSALEALAEGEKRVAELAVAQKEMSLRLEERLQQQEVTDRMTRDYLIKIADVHASAFTELLGVLPTDLANAEIVNRLKNKGLELQARMDLAHPDPTRLFAAISTLAAVGTKVAIPDLERVKNDRRSDNSTSLHANEALRKIRTRSPEPEVPDMPQA